MFQKKRRPVTPRDPHKIQYYNWRFRIVLGLIALVFLGLLARLVDLMVIDHNFLQRQGDMRALRTIEMQAYRGIISDRNGNPLAVSSPVYSVWVDPKSFKADSRQLNQLAALLQEPVSQIQRDVQKNQNREFMYLKRQLPPPVGEKIDALAIPGVFLKQEFRRFYPEGEVTAHVVGLTNVDDQGQEGLELAYNNWLGGVSGIRRVIQDRYGHIVADVNLIREPSPGKNLELSIDKRIQYIAYRELKAQAERVGASAGSVVILDVHTGEVLAMANYPSYNPNDRPTQHDDRFRNRAVTDTFEPGSTIKTFSATVGLTSGKYTPDSIIDTAPGWYLLAGHRVEDEHNKGDITLTDVLKYSSNVGISKVVSSLPSDLLPSLLERLKFGQKTTVNFPGESAGYLPERTVWPPFTLATLSFGYGLTVTPLQLAHAYLVLANGGRDKPISLLKVEGDVPNGEQIIDPKVAQQVTTMLEGVVEPGGTSTEARVPGYWVAGKSGTTRLVGLHGYQWNHHNAIFAGFAPASNPRIVVVIFIHDPVKVTYWGGYVSGQVFSKVMGSTLRLLNIAPDHLGQPDQGTDQ